MKISIGDVVRTPRWNYDQPKWVIATVREIVTGYKGTVQYRVEDSEGDSKYMCRDDFEIVKNVPIERNFHPDRFMHGTIDYIGEYDFPF